MNTIRFLQMYPALTNIVPEPEQATKNVPLWYKDQPAISGSDIPDRGIMRLTVKKCQAFFDAMAMGYILKVPCDIYLDTTDGNINLQLPAAMNKYY